MAQEAVERAAIAYESLLVPSLFAPWAEVTADAAGTTAGRRVLDVGCGTGVVAREIAGRADAAQHITGLDANPFMLEVGRRFAPQIDWREGDGHALPFADASFEVVLSQFALMLFDDPGAAIGEMVRVLATDGRLVVVVFDSLDRIPAYATMARLFGRLAGERYGAALRAPFRLGDANELRELFEKRPGLTSVELRTLQRRARFASVEEMVLADVRGWFPVAGLELDEATLTKVVDAAREEMRPFTDGDAVEFEVSAHLVSATAS